MQCTSLSPEGYKIYCINTNKIPGELLREKKNILIFSKITVAMVR